MVGRLAYNSPWDIVKIDRALYGYTADSLNREEIIRVFILLFIS